MSDDPKTELTPADQPTRYCGSCINRLLGDGGLECWWTGTPESDPAFSSGAIHSGPHACEGWGPSDDHLRAKAAETQAGSVAFLARVLYEMLDEPAPPAADQCPTTPLRCDVCYTQFAVAIDETECSCTKCGKGFELNDGSWEDA